MYVCRIGISFELGSYSNYIVVLVDVGMDGRIRIRLNVSISVMICVD